MKTYHPFHPFHRFGRLLALVAVLFGPGALAQAQEVGELRHRVERMPWRLPGDVVECGGNIYIVSINGLFASSDGATWQLEVPASRASFIWLYCFDDVAWGVGRPGIIARHDPAMGWVFEHRIEYDDENSTFHREPDVHLLERVGRAGRFRAQGWVDGELIALTRNRDGTWRQRPTEPRLYHPPPSPPEECRLPPRRSSLPAGRPVIRAVVCPGRLLLYTDARGRRPDVSVPIPAQVRDAEWEYLGTEEGQVILTRPSREDDITERATHFEILRYASGGWDITEVREKQLGRGLASRNGVVLVFGKHRLYHLEAPTVASPPADESPRQ